MKQIVLLCALTSLLGAEEVELIFQPYQPKSTLSEQQDFQLNFLKSQLQQYAPQVKQSWTNNIDVRLMIEDAELAVQQSTFNTQPIMRQSIIDIFQSFDINIYFTANNLIRRVKNQIPAIKPAIYNIQKEQEDKNEMAHLHIHIPHNNPYEPPTPPKIKGAQKTFKKLAQARLEREAKERQAWLDSIKLQEQERLEAIAERLKEQQAELMEHYRIQHQEQIENRNDSENNDEGE